VFAAFAHLIVPLQKKAASEEAAPSGTAQWLRDAPLLPYHQ
jgi:hypothetical protein